jgi:hypothetical protein
LIVRNTAGSELERASAFGGQVADLSHKAANFFASQIGGRVIRAARSPVLAAGQQTIESMKHSTGVGDPENGHRFGEGADKMEAVGQVLVSAFPDDNWDSSGASAYAGRNAEQVGRVQTMLGLDTMVAEVLSTEAGQIAATRDSLDGHSDWLGAMSMLTTSAGIVPGFGPAAQMTAEFAMVAKAVGDSDNDLRTLCGHIEENAAVLQSAAVQYENLAGSATSAEFEPPADDSEVPTVPADPDASDPATLTGGDDAPSDSLDSEVPSGGGGDVPSGTGGAAPSTGGGVGMPSGSSLSQSMPTGMPAAGASPSDAATSAAGALGGILGSLVSPLSGILAGITQAAQAATQAAQMASQAAGQAGGPAADADELDDRDEDRDGRDRDDEKDEHSKERETDGEDGKDQVGEPEEGEAGGVAATDSAGVPADPPGAGADDEAAKTLPPDLEATAAGGAAAGQAPVHVGADFEQGQLHVAAAATLDRGVPGSAAVIDR